MLKTRTCLSLSIAQQLQDADIDPDDVKRIIVSHFHPDHIAELKDFPNAEIIASRRAWEAVKKRTGLRAFLCGYLPKLLPEDFNHRLHLVDSFADPGVGSLEQSCDLFGDQSVRLFELSGHAIGQIGALVGSDLKTGQFLVADAAWTSTALLKETMPHWLTRVFIGSFKEMEATLKKLKAFNQQFPEVKLIPTHCPAVAEEFGFDEEVTACIGQRVDR